MLHRNFFISLTLGLAVLTLACGDASDRSDIAFTSCTGKGSQRTCEIYAVNADGYNLRSLTRDAVRNHSPVWSPDGKRIAFISTLSGEPAIYVVNSDGSDAATVAGSTGAGSPPAWTSDGKRLSFDADGYLYTATVGGDQAPDGLSLKRDDYGGPPDPPDPGGFAWSPDQARVAFHVGYFERPSELHVMNADGSGLVHLGRGAWPAWSRDGTRFAYLGCCDGASDEWAIYTADPDGSNRSRLTSTDLEARGGPSWSPDGARLAFGASQRDEDTTELYIMNIDESNIVPIAPWDFSFTAPQWSPNGEEIAFWYMGGIYVVRADGSELTNITQSDRLDYDPVWSPLASRN